MTKEQDLKKEIERLEKIYNENYKRNNKAGAGGMLSNISNARDLEIKKAELKGFQEGLHQYNKELEDQTTEDREKLIEFGKQQASKNSISFEELDKKVEVLIENLTDNEFEKEQYMSPETIIRAWFQELKQNHCQGVEVSTQKDMRQSHETSQKDMDDGEGGKLLPPCPDTSIQTKEKK